MASELTLAVPTFNRRDAIVENTRHALQGIDGMPIEYLVIDNASDDGTYKSLINEFGDNAQATFLRNSENIGYFGNFLKILKSCRTRYILISSDEDYFLTENIQYLLNFLKQKNPLMVSGQVVISEKNGLYRGRNNISKVTDREVRDSSNYISGIVFDCLFLRDYLYFFEKNTKNQMVFIYPQVVLASILFLKGDLYWIDVQLTKKKYQLESDITDTDGGKYFNLESRVRQARDYDKLLNDISDEFGNSEKVKILKKQNMDKTFSVFRHALNLESNKGFLNSFDESAQIFYLKKMICNPWVLFSIVKKYIGRKLC
jgi:hypothetical protein